MIFITAPDESETREGLAINDDVVCLRKPFEGPVLLGHVRDALARRSG